MWENKHTRYILIAVPILLCAVILLWFKILHPTHYIAPPGRITASVLHWEDRIKTLGAESAYAEFGETIATSTVNEQHRAAHDFGKALYFAAGIDSWIVCGTVYSMGCMHEFLSEVASDRGIVAVTRLANSCSTIYNDPQGESECAHSLGHGLLSYFGYSDSALHEALRFCEPMSTLNAQSGCLHGVFMEYNEQFFLGPIRVVRKPTDGNIYEPCDSLSGQEKKSCVYLQPNWWWKIEPKNSDIKNSFAQMGYRCAHIANGEKDVEESCLRGVGYAANFASKFNATTTTALCDSATTSAANREICLSQAAFTIALHVGSSAASNVCAELPTGERATCEVEAQQNTLK